MSSFNHSAIIVGANHSIALRADKHQSRLAPETRLAIAETRITSEKLLDSDRWQLLAARHCKTSQGELAMALGVGNDEVRNNNDERNSIVRMHESGSLNIRTLEFLSLFGFRHSSFPPSAS